MGMNKIAKWAVDEAPKYWKAIISTAPLVVYVGTEVVQDLHVAGADGSLTASDLVKVVMLAATAYGVYKKTNRAATG
jgi:hypothetical protein